MKVVHLGNIMITNDEVFNDIRSMKRDFITASASDDEVKDLIVGDLIHFYLGYTHKEEGVTKEVIVSDTPRDEVYLIKYIDESDVDNNVVAIGFDKCYINKVNKCEVKAKKF